MLLFLRNRLNRPHKRWGTKINLHVSKNVGGIYKIFIAKESVLETISSGANIKYANDTQIFWPVFINYANKRKLVSFFFLFVLTVAGTGYLNDVNLGLFYGRKFDKKIYRGREEIKNFANCKRNYRRQKYFQN